jgi:hypothetical protein
MLPAGQVVDERLGDILKVWLPNGAVLAAVNLMTIKGCLELALITVSIVYTLWRWRRDTYVACEGCRAGKIPIVCPLPVKRRPWWCPKNS